MENMEDYAQLSDEQQQQNNNNNTSTRGNSTFLYTTASTTHPTPPVNIAHHHHHDQSSSSPHRHHHHHDLYGPRTTSSIFHLIQSSGVGVEQPNNFLSSDHHEPPHPSPPTVKAEAASAAAPSPSSSHQQLRHHREFHHYSLIRREDQNHHQHDTDHNNRDHHHPPHHHLQQQRQLHQRSGGGNDYFDAIKAKIITHPQYSNLLEAYMDCQKVGAPPEVVARLTQAQQEFATRQKSLSMMSRDGSSSSSISDPELDQFMEAYYDMLVKYREELTRPLQEAMEFMRRIEAQFNTLTTTGPIRLFTDEKCEGVGSSEDDQENSGGETELHEIDPRAEDRELKNHLLKKYSGGYLSSLKQELSKKKKKGKLPKDARQKLLNWWELHYKWPYPSETEKVALAESTGLDQKQINNWFINQRKRHWKPSEDMQFLVMDGLHPPW